MAFAEKSEALAPGPRRVQQACRAEHIAHFLVPRLNQVILPADLQQEQPDALVVQAA